MTKFTVLRERWLRGEGPDFSSLRRPKDGKMCCLGFLGVACGAVEEYLTDKLMPFNVKEDVKWPEKLLTPPEFYGYYRISKINDDEFLPDAEREESLKKVFAEYGVEIEFV